MHKNFFFLLVLLSLVPACFKRKSAVVIPNQVITEEVTAVIQEPAIAEDLAPEAFDEEQNQEQANDVNEYVFDQKGESPFDQNAAQNYEELALEEADSKPSDLLTNSKKYGFKTVHYNFNKKSLRTDQREIAKANLKIAKDLVAKGHDIVIEGHACDSAGSPQYNLVLSEDRAKSMMQYFASNGIDKSHIKIVGRGSEILLVKAGSREDQAPNRRVEIYAYNQATHTA